MRLIAVDPGLSGGIAILDGKGRFLACHPMPIKWKNEDRRELDPVALAPLLKGASLVLLERQRPFPGQGVSSVFSLGETCGVIRGVCAAMGLPMQYVEARLWKKFYNLPGGRDNKPLAISRAIDLFPTADLSGAKKEGMSEALLMARYYLVAVLNQSS